MAISSGGFSGYGYRVAPGTPVIPVVPANRNELKESIGASNKNDGSIISIPLVDGIILGFVVFIMFGLITYISFNKKVVSFFVMKPLYDDLEEK